MKIFQCLRKAMIVLMIAVMFLLQIANVPAMAAVTEDRQDNVTKKFNHYSQQVFEKIRSFQISYYNGVYSFGNWSYTVYNEKENSGIIEADIKVTCDMKLVRNYSENPFYHGILSVYEQQSGDPSAASIVAEFANAYKEQVESYYMVPYNQGFVYHVSLDTATGEITLYLEISLGDESMLRQVAYGDKFEDLATFSRGVAAAEQLISRSLLSEPAEFGYSYYDRTAAVDYALEHALDEPEFYLDKNSDCANFVSKCINAGGIPEDVSGKWYRATTYGDVYTAGINWIRTGRNEGGVIPYFTEKGYIYSVTDAVVQKGTLMYWTTKSHVAIVTYADGSTIRYAQHSNKKESVEEHIYDAGSQRIHFYDFR